MSLVKLQVKDNQSIREGNGWTERNGNDAKTSKLCPLREMTKSILGVGQGE